MKLIVGLGNPGDQYDSTRHNLGFAVIDALSHKFGDLKSKIKVVGEVLILAKTENFMNDSGIGVRKLMDFYKVKTGDVVIIHDDIDLKLGQLKVRQGGSSAGHKGVESVIAKLGTDDFIRLRLGIASEDHHGLAKNVEKFVVSVFISHEKSKVKHMIKRAVLAVEILLKEGIGPAQNQFN